MGVELKDFRGKITPEADCVLEAESRSTGRERQEIVREIIHDWAMQRIHGASVLNRLLHAEGLVGIDGGGRRESRGIAGHAREEAGMTVVIDHGQDDPIAFDLTPTERDAAAFAQAQLRLERNSNHTKRGVPNLFDAQARSNMAKLAGVDKAAS